MDKKKMREFLNRITNSRFVNLYFEGMKDPVDPGKSIYEEIKEGKYTRAYCIDVDIDSLPGAEKDMKEAGRDLAGIINREMAEKRFPHWIRESISIEHTLEQFDKRLDSAALIIFHYFKKPEDRKEKDILTSLRKFIDKNNPLYVQILIISSKKTEKWDLAPNTLLDERFVKYIPWNNLQ